MMQKRLGWRFRQRHSIPDWIEHRYDGLRYARKVLVTRPENLVGYWPMWEGNGGVSFDNAPQGNHDGAYTGVTLAEPGIGDGRYSAFFDGANDFNNLLSPALAAAFNGAAGTALIWARVANAGVWTDGNHHLIMYVETDLNNRLDIRKQATNNRIAFNYQAGGVVEQINLDGQTTLDWMVLGITWDRAAGVNGEFRAFFGGVQTGATQVALGIWVGVPAIMLIGAISLLPTTAWNGWEAHGALWDVALTPAEVAFPSTLG